MVQLNRFALFSYGRMMPGWFRRGSNQGACISQGGDTVKRSLWAYNEVPMEIFRRSTETPKTNGWIPKMTPCLKPEIHLKTIIFGIYVRFRECNDFELGKCSVLLGRPGKEVLGSMVIGSVGYIPHIHHL